MNTKISAVHDEIQYENIFNKSAIEDLLGLV